MSVQNLDVYRVETFDAYDDLENNLHRMWDIGWQLVSIIPGGAAGPGWTSYIAVFINRGVLPEVPEL